MIPGQRLPGMWKK